MRGREGGRESEGERERECERVSGWVGARYIVREGGRERETH